ncbi:TPA: hypothetical protein ACRRFX_002306 [Acinetobacter baumannii]|uniref:hypothetical protein n=1 Tax=Acinetobacter baumannii TaxID=470 RepID=UPI00292C8EA0|nr:hypothetical protein [Acinetobacter baumannii]HAV6254745.1 hypothetical protein [Acinetobacter baumannii]HEC0322853.1 hypothetical protein [Acinetobacter baumannii]
MFDVNKEREAFEAWLIKKFDLPPKSFSLDFNDGVYDSIPTQARWEAWKERAKAQAVRPQKYFSHDFNGDGFKYHDSLDEAQKEAEASLDWYRDKVADGHHVAEDGEFYELCYGVVIASAGYTVDEVVTEEHHKKDEFTKYEVGTEILRLHFNKCNSESGAEG